MLSDVSNIVQTVGFPLALVGIFLAYREGRNSCDLQAALSVAESFRGRWEGSWRKALDEADGLARKDQAPTGGLREELFNILNWLDGVGWLIESHALTRPRTVLASVAPQVKRAIVVTTPVLEADEAMHEPGYWRGVRALEKVIAGIQSVVADIDQGLPFSYDAHHPADGTTTI